MTIIYGVDLGTTYSKCGLVRPSDGVVRVFELDAEQPGATRNTMVALRSAVTLTTDGERRVAYVGCASWNVLKDWDEETDPPFRRFEESKLWIGEGAQDDPEAPPWGFDPHGWEYRPEDIGALVLRKVKREVERDQGPRMTHIVLTHPQSFTESRREATRQAAAVAGIEVVDTLTEPDAALIAYRGNGQDGTYLVFDLGGGTLDITIARVGGGRSEVLTSEGIRQGGRDWDRAILGRMIEFYNERFPAFQPEYLDDRTRQDWLRKAEEIKWQLSMPDSSIAKRKIECRNAAFCDGMVAPFTLTRVDLDELGRPLVDDCRRAVRRALDNKSLRWSDISAVLLVGGSTQLPAIREMLRGESGQTLNTALDPSIAVAQGAAIYAHRLSQSGAARGPSLAVGTAPGTSRASIAIDAGHVGALARGLGVRAWDPKAKQDVIFNLIPKDSPVPTSKEAQFTTSFDGQRSIEVELWEGESLSLAECERLGTCVLPDIPPGPAGKPVSVRIDIAPNGSKHILVTAAGRTREEVIRFDPERVVDHGSLEARRAFVETIDVR